MKTIAQYLSGEHDEELRTLVAETRGYKNIKGDWCWDFRGIEMPGDRPIHLTLPPYPTSRDSCEELLADLTEEEGHEFASVLAGIVIYNRQTGWWDLEAHEAFHFLRTTARQICVAYLIVKGVLK